MKQTDDYHPRLFSFAQQDKFWEIMRLLVSIVREWESCKRGVKPVGEGGIRIEINNVWVVVSTKSSDICPKKRKKTGKTLSSKDKYKRLFIYLFIHLFIFLFIFFLFQFASIATTWKGNTENDCYVFTRGYHKCPKVVFFWIYLMSILKMSRWICRKYSILDVRKECVLKPRTRPRKFSTENSM